MHASGIWVFTKSQLQVTPSGSIVPEKQKMHCGGSGSVTAGAKCLVIMTTHLYTLNLQISISLQYIIYTITQGSSFLGRREISRSQGFSDFYPEELPRRGLQTDLAMSFGCRKGRFWSKQQNSKAWIHRSAKLARPLDSLGSSAKVGARAMLACRSVSQWHERAGRASEPNVVKVDFLVAIM